MPPPPAGTQSSVRQTISACAAKHRARFDGGPWLVFGAGAALLIFEAVAIGVQETATASDMTFQRTLGLGIVLLTMAGTYTLQIRTAARLSRSRTTRRPVAVNARRHDERVNLAG